jgi:hypothetical protein
MMDILVCFPQFLCPSGAITPPNSNMELPKNGVSEHHFPIEYGHFGLHSQ